MKQKIILLIMIFTVIFFVACTDSNDDDVQGLDAGRDIEVNASMEIKEGTLRKEGCTIIVHNDSDCAIFFGDICTLMRWKNGDWRVCDFIDSFPHNTDINFLRSGHKVEIPTSFLWYGGVYEGKWKLSLSISVDSLSSDPAAPGTIEVTSLETEFEIT